MSSPSALGTAQRTVVLGAVLLVSFGYFYEGGGWNQNTRFDLVRAIVERQTLQIDTYHDNTGDKAELDGHVYADKAPGASFTAVPVVALVRWGMAAAGRDAYSASSITALSYAATLSAAAVPATLAALCVFWMVRRLGYGDDAAGLAAIACGLGTPLWAYATLLYGHALAAGCLAYAWYGAVALEDVPARSKRRAWLVGLAAGWAVVTEFPASVPSALIVAWLLWHVRRSPRRVPIAAALVGGLSLNAIALLTYNWIAFHDVLHIGYSSEAGYEAMRTGVFGVNVPKADVAAALLFGRFRGLLPLAPALVAAPIGLWLLLREEKARAAALLGAVVILFYFLMTAGYAYWDGGWSYGSRHLGPTLPFLAFMIGPVWRRASRLGRVLLLVLIAAGVGQSLVAVATTPQPPGGASAPADPMRQLLWPAFVSGDFPIGWQTVLEYRAPAAPMSELERLGIPRASWNLGQLAGLRGHLSLVPLWLAWAVAALFWRRAMPS